MRYIASPMWSKLERLWQTSWVERSPKERAYLLSVAFVLLVGVAFRSNRYFIDPIALWGDEAMWARRMLDNPLSTPTFRPIGFMALCRGLVQWLAVDERVLRLPSYLASLASLFLFADVGRRLLTSRVVLLLLIAMASAQPMLVDFAKEFKPYSVELCAHLWLVWCALRAFEQPSAGRMGLLLVSLPLVLCFAYNVIFFYPVVFTLLGIRWLGAKGRLGLIGILASVSTCLVALGVLYALIISQLPENEDDSQFWGKKYGVFYIDDGRSNQVTWQVTKAAELVAMPGAARAFWQPPSWISERAARELGGVESLSWVVLYVLGLTALARQRRWVPLALLTGPVLVTLAFNLASAWPWGSFRTNLFLFAYVLPMPFVGLDLLVRRGPWSARLVPVAFVLLHLVPVLAFGFGMRAEKRAWTGHSEIPRILARIRADREARLAREPGAAKEMIFLDAYSCETFPFYLKTHARVSREQRQFFEANFDWKCIYQPKDTARAVEQRRGQPTWSIVSNQVIVESMYQHLSKAGRVVIDERPTYNHRLIKLAD